MPQKRPGWDPPEHTPYCSAAGNVLCVCILFLIAWGACSTWFMGPHMLACLILLFGGLTFSFFKNPVATLVLAIAVLVSIVAFPHPITHNHIPSPSSAPSAPPNPPNPPYPSPTTEHVQPNTPPSYTPEIPTQHQPIEESYNQEKEKEKEKEKEEPPKKPKETPISVDDIILGPGVEVARGSRPTITISGGGMICEGEAPNVTLSFSMTGKGPWQFSYYLEGDNDQKFTTSDKPTHKVHVDRPGTYKLSKSGEDAVCGIYDVFGEAVVTMHKKPTIEVVSSNVEVCDGEVGKIEAILHGTPPFTVTYDDGTRVQSQVVTSSSMKWQASKQTFYSISSVSDKYCKNSNIHIHPSISILPLPSIALAGGKCYGDDVVIKATGRPPFTIELTNPHEEFIIQDHTLVYPTASKPNLQAKHLMFRLLRDASCSVPTSLLFAELHELPTATLIDAKHVVKKGEKVNLEIKLTGTAPWDVWYSSPLGLMQVHIKHSPYYITHQEEGKYALLNVTDAYCKNKATGSTEIFTFTPPTVTVSTIDPLCTGAVANLNIEFTGRPPFTFTYSFAGQRSTNTTSTPVVTFSTTENGNFKLEEFTDFFNYPIRPGSQYSREVKFVAPPTYNVNAATYSCNHAKVDVAINIYGTGPFSIDYMLNESFHSIQDVDSLLSFSIPTPTLVTLLHIRDKYSCEGVASNDEILHFTSKAIPDLEIIGGDCSPITLRFHGVPPFTLQYSYSAHPHQDVNFSEKEFDDYTAYFTDAGTYVFKAVSDSYCKQQFSNVVKRTILQAPTAELGTVREKLRACEIEPRHPKDELLEVALTGKPPFDLIVQSPDGVTELNDIATDKTAIPVTKTGDYQILKVSDGNCRGTVVGGKKSVVIDYHETPSVILSGGGEICQGETVDLQFDMTGTGPWDVEFSNGKLQYVFESKKNQYKYQITTMDFTSPQEKSGRYTVTSLMDSNCKGRTESNYVDVLVHPLPTARVHGGGVVCQGEETVLKISLTGTPPWSLSISRNTSDTKIPLAGITESEIEVTTDEPGFFYIDYIEDKHCKYRRVSVPVPV